MPKFIKLNEQIVNVDQVAKAEFISDDIYEGLFPDEMVDWVPFEFGKITLKSGEEISLILDLYKPEKGQTNEEWESLYRSFINRMWQKLMDSLGEIEPILGLEYKEA
ncbi:hypothetical protein [Halanaerobium salsuginis]|uniref:Uncharacterized protein n=1 Tax=Halanaerobium salsuginis TaxID=29563 RepID=A0A1I4EYB3_9FIRM|nr:hypothetical protein [Halanaerobium salsuginis]SFL09567.1 hypothetical protein SAMN02983006_00166 [Halanaerobium salsuginis]